MLRNLKSAILDCGSDAGTANGGRVFCKWKQFGEREDRVVGLAGEEMDAYRGMATSQGSEGVGEVGV